MHGQRKEQHRVRTRSPLSARPGIYTRAVLLEGFAVAVGGGPGALDPPTERPGTNQTQAQADVDSGCNVVVNSTDSNDGRLYKN